MIVYALTLDNAVTAWSGDAEFAERNLIPGERIVTMEKEKAIERYNQGTT